MNFNKHSNLEGLHAFLGASKYHWINYDEKKLIDSYTNFRAAQKGTELHEFAATCIKLRQKLPKSQKTLILGHLQHFNTFKSDNKGDIGQLCRGVLN